MVLVLAAAFSGCGSSSDDLGEPRSSGGSGAAGGTDATGGTGAATAGGAGGQAGTGQGGSGQAGSGEAGGGSGGTGGEPPEAVGCNGVPLLDKPDDPGARGPWSVGARTVHIGALTTEVFYPAAAGSDAGLEPVVYDPRAWLPPAEQSKIPDSDNPWQSCACVRDLPLDTAHGPYPVVVFVHGTAAFRTQSLSAVVHWASRGFVVLAADHPGLYLGDYLAFQVTNDLPRDVRALLAALDPARPELGFLAGRLDLDRVAMVGHSAGGRGIAGFGATPGVRVLIPMAAGGVEPGASLTSTLVMGALDDKIVAYSQQIAGYESSPARKRLVGLGNAGHLAFSDLCGLKNGQGQDLVAIAQEHGIANSQFATFLWDGCEPGKLGQDAASEIVRFATSAVLEETLHCTPPAAELFGLRARFPAATEYRELM